MINDDWSKLVTPEKAQEIAKIFVKDARMHFVPILPPIPPTPKVKPVYRATFKYDEIDAYTSEAMREIQAFVQTKVREIAERQWLIAIARVTSVPPNITLVAPYEVVRWETVQSYVSYRADYKRMCATGLKHFRREYVDEVVAGYDRELKWARYTANAVFDLDQCDIVYDA